MAFPRDFKSQSEWDGYCSCLKKIKLGDEVEVFFSYANVRVAYSRYDVDNSRIVKVVGKRPFDWLLGSKSQLPGFWEMYPKVEYYTGMKRIPQFNAYHYGYWVEFVDPINSNVRVKKLYRA